jgi:DNA-binding MurR/RpiR family transcriptional regulator
MDIIKDYIDKYDQRSMKLKQTITNELIVALIGRFERNEKMMQELNEKMDSAVSKIQNNMERSMKELREEISEAELNKAISKLFDEKEIKVNSKVLQDLREI